MMSTSRRGKDVSFLNHHLHTDSIPSRTNLTSIRHCINQPQPSIKPPASVPPPTPAPVQPNDLRVRNTAKRRTRLLSSTLILTLIYLITLALRPLPIVLAQTSLRWSIVGLPLTVDQNTIQPFVTFTVQPLLNPLGSVTLTPSTTTTNAGYFVPTSLTFVNNASAPSTQPPASQTMQYFTPSFPSTVTVIWNVTGNSAGAFKPEPSPNIINVLAPISVSGAPTSAIYTNQKVTSMTLLIPSPSSAVNPAGPVYPFSVVFGCITSTGANVPGCILTPSQISVTSVAAANGASFVLTAPPNVPTGGQMYVNMSVVSFNGLALSYFRVISPMTISVKAQSVFTISSVATAIDYSTGLFKVHAYSSLVLTFTPTASIIDQTTLLSFTIVDPTFSLGSVAPSPLTWYAGDTSQSSQTITYTAPTSAVVEQRVTIQITMTSENSDGTLSTVVTPQFVAPTLTVLLKDPQIFGVCAPSLTVIITGFLSDETYLNGVYEADEPFNSNSHYVLWDYTQNPVNALAHLFYFVDPSGNSWMIESDLLWTDTRHLTAYVSVESTAPFSSAWSRRLLSGATVAAPMLTVTCSADCSRLGTDRSLESLICLGGNGNSFLSGTTVPVTGTCPSLSCARYLPYIVSKCSTTAYWNVTGDLQSQLVARGLVNLTQTCNGITGTGLPPSAIISAYGPCNDSTIELVVERCGFTSLKGSDLTQDLSQMLNLPSNLLGTMTTCDTTCSSVYLPFYSQCIAPLPSFQIDYTTFAQICRANTINAFTIPATPTNLRLTDVTESGATLTWSPVDNTAGNLQSLSYRLDIFRNWTTGSALVTPSLNQWTGPWTSIYNGTRNYFTTSTSQGLLPNTSYGVRVWTVNANSGSLIYSAASPVMIFNTLLVYPLPPAAPFVGTLTVVPPIGVGLPSTVSTYITWLASVGTGIYGSSLAVEYQLVLVPSSTSVFTVAGLVVWNWDLARPIYRGQGLGASLTGLQPGSWYLVSIQTRWVNVNSVTGATISPASRWSTITFGANFWSATSFATPQLPPTTPEFLPIPSIVSSVPTPSASALPTVTSQSVTLSWLHVPSCGGADCTDATYVIEMQKAGPTSANKYNAGAQPTSASWQSIYNLAFNQVAFAQASTATNPFIATSTTPNQLVLSTTYYGVTPGQDYVFRLSATNTAGTSVSSRVLSISTAPVVPTVNNLPLISVISPDSVTAYWNLSSSYWFSDGGAPITMYHFQASPIIGSPVSTVLDYYVSAEQLFLTSLNPVTAPLTTLLPGGNISIFNTSAALMTEAYSYTLSGLAPSQTYQFSLEIFHLAADGASVSSGSAGAWSGLSHSSLTTVTLPDTPPRLLSLTAIDPTGLSTGFGVGSIFMFVFSKATSQPNVSNQTYVDQLIQWSSVIPGTYAGVWSADGMTLNITVQTFYGGGPSSIPSIGVFTGRIVGSLFNAALTSTNLNLAPSTSNTAVLLGNWASQLTPGTLPPPLLTSTINNLPMIMESVVDYYPLNIITNPAGIAAGLYSNTTLMSIVIYVSNGLLSYPFYPGSNTVAGLKAGVLTQAESFTLTSYSYGSLISTNPWTNPLLQFAYTPDPGFYGQDILTITISSPGSASGITPTTQTMNYPLRVRQVNHAPLVIVPSVPREYNLYSLSTAAGASQLRGVLLTGLVITDSDHSSFTPISVTLTAAGISATTGRFSLVQDISIWLTSNSIALALIPSATNTGRVGLSCTISSAEIESASSLVCTGYTGLMTAFLTTNVLFSDPASVVDADATTVLPIRIQVDDMGSGIVLDSPTSSTGYVKAASLSTWSTYSFQPSCIGATAPVLLSAAFTPDGASIRLVFDSPALRLVAPYGITPYSQPLSSSSCELFLDSPTMALLGTGSECFLSSYGSVGGSGNTGGTIGSSMFGTGSTSTLTVRLAIDASITIGDTISLSPSSTILRRCSSALSWANTGSAFVQGPSSVDGGSSYTGATTAATYLPPSILLSGPSSIGICEDLILTTNVYNVSSRDLAQPWSTTGLKYVWEVLNGTGTIVTSSILGDDLSSNSVGASSLTISSTLLQAGSTYRFSVFVINRFGLQSATSFWSVTKLGKVIPTLQPLTPIYQQRSHLDAIHLDFKIARLKDECITGFSASNKKFSISWSLVASSPVGASASNNYDTLSLTTTSFGISANSLQPASSYIFQAFVYMGGDSSGTVYGSATLRFNITTFSVAEVVIPSEQQLFIQHARMNMKIPFTFGTIRSNALPLFDASATTTATSILSQLSASSVITWSCVPVTQSLASNQWTYISPSITPCYNASTQTVIGTLTTLNSQPDLLVNAGSLVKGTYLFTAFIPIGTQNGGTSTPIARVWVTIGGSGLATSVYSSILPQFQVRLSTTIPTLNLLIGPDDPLILTGSLFMPNSATQLLPNLAALLPGSAMYNLTSGLQYSWSLVGLDHAVGSIGSNFVQYFTDSAITTGVNTLTLSINVGPFASNGAITGIKRNVFPRGASLRFRLTVRDSRSPNPANDAIWSEIVVRVKSPPHYGGVGTTAAVSTLGGFSVNPTNGWSHGVTTFTVTASTFGWVSGVNRFGDRSTVSGVATSGAPLHYAYSYLNPYSAVPRRIPFGTATGAPDDSDIIVLGGLARDSYLVTIYLTVTDLSTGWSTTTSQRVVVQPSPAYHGLSLAANANRLNLLQARYEELITARNQPAALAVLTAYSSLAMYQSNNATVASLSAAVALGQTSVLTYPRCSGVSVFSTAVQWQPVLYGSSPTPSNKNVDISNVTLSQGLAQALNMVTNLINLASTTSTTVAAAGIIPNLASSSAGYIRPGLPTGFSTASQLQPIELCLNLGSNAATDSSATLIAGLISTCSKVLQNALLSAQNLCVGSNSGAASGSSDSCSQSYHQLFSTIIHASIGLWELEYTSAVTTLSISAETIGASTRRRLLKVDSPQQRSLLSIDGATSSSSSRRLLGTSTDDFNAYSTFLSMIHGSLDLYSLAGLLSLPGQVITFGDCEFPIVLRRDWNGQPVTQRFALDGSTVWFPAGWFGPASLSASSGNPVTDQYPLNQTVIDSRILFSYLNDFSWNTQVSTILSGVMTVQRSYLVNGVITPAPVTMNLTMNSTRTPAMIITLAYDNSTTSACNSTLCQPQCVIYNTVLNLWWNATMWNSSDATTLSQFSAQVLLTTQFPSVNVPSTSGYADCIIYSPISNATVALTTAPIPVVSMPSSSSSTGVAYSSSSTGASGPVDPYGLCATCYGPLGGPPNQTLPSPGYQMWGINCTLFVSLSSDFITPTSAAALQSDLVLAINSVLPNGTYMNASRIQVVSMLPGSIISQIYILPASTNFTVNSTTLTPLAAPVIFALLFAQANISSSVLLQGSISGFTPNFTSATYFPVTVCPDGSYQVGCTIASSSTGTNGNSSSTGGMLTGSSSTGTLLVDTSSSSSFLTGSDLLIFCLALGIGIPFICLLIGILFILQTRKTAHSLTEKEMIAQIERERQDRELGSPKNDASAPAPLDPDQRVRIPLNVAGRSDEIELTPPMGTNNISPPSTNRDDVNSGSVGVALHEVPITMTKEINLDPIKVHTGPPADAPLSRPTPEELINPTIPPQLTPPASSPTSSNDDVTPLRLDQTDSDSATVSSATTSTSDANATVQPTTQGPSSTTSSFKPHASLSGAVRAPFRRTGSTLPSSSSSSTEVAPGSPTSLVSDRAAAFGGVKPSMRRPVSTAAFRSGSRLKLTSDMIAEASSGMIIQSTTVTSTTSTNTRINQREGEQ